MRTPLLLAVCQLLLCLGPVHADTIKVSDDGALQAAFDAAADGDTIVISKGDYTGPFDVAGKTNLTVKAKGAFLQAGGGGAEGVVAVAITVSQSTGIVFQGLRFVGASTQAFELTDCQDVTIKKCRFQAIETGAVLSQCSDIEVRSCAFDDVGGLGLSFDTCHMVDVLRNRFAPFNVGIEARALTHANILRNTFRDGTGSSVYIESDDGAVSHTLAIERNRVVDQLDDSMEIEGEGILVRLNRFRNMESEAFTIRRRPEETTQPITCTLNRIFDAPSSAAMRFSGDRMTVTKNRMMNCSSGLRASGDGYTIRGNVSRQCNTGFDLDVSESEVVKNLAKDSLNKGFDSDSGNTLNFFAQNRAIGSQVSGFVLDDNGSEFFSNVAKNGDGFGFRVLGTGNYFEENLGTQNAQADLQDFNITENTYVANQFDNTQTTPGF